MQYNNLDDKHIDNMTARGVLEIGDAVRDLAERARGGKLQLHEFQGGSFT
jgi:pyruvate/2-oxoglutarate dehydrogenase complex dihydrolipoamide acyltransferase (E2) component